MSGLTNQTPKFKAEKNSTDCLGTPEAAQIDASIPQVQAEIVSGQTTLQSHSGLQTRDDLEILTMQRLALAKHDAFKVIIAGQPTRLQPDGMFLHRQAGKGMMACFVEMDLDSMSLKQMVAKFQQYQAWAESAGGPAFLNAVYGRNGATSPSAAFRILVKVSSRENQAEHRRVIQLLDLAKMLPKVVRDRIWVTAFENLHSAGVLNQDIHRSDLVPTHASPMTQVLYERRIERVVDLRIPAQTTQGYVSQVHYFIVLMNNHVAKIENTASNCLTKPSRTTNILSLS